MDKLQFLAAVNADDLSIVSKRKVAKDLKAPPKKKLKKERKLADNDSALEDTARKAFTKNWDQSMKMTESLPVKLNGKVVRSMREKKEVVNDENSESEDVNEVSEDDNSFSDNGSECDAEEVGPEHIPLPQKKQQASFEKKRLDIAEICHAVTTDPMRAVQKRRETDPADDIRYITELLAYFSDADCRVQEVAMLSGLLVFKDICPGYRIRTNAEFEQGVQLKKETKKLRDFEVAVLHNYQYYVRYLDKTVQNGLGSLKRTSPLVDSTGKTTAQWELGLSALRCLCELMRSLIHFNLRSIVLTSIVARAGQHIEGISSICCRTIRDVFVSDKEGDVIFELVGLMGKHLQGCKYDVPESFMRCFENIKFTVHADSAKDIRRKAKQNRRKRKRAGDEVEAALQETDMNAQKINAKRFQADALHEVCIIYFRVIKLKVGFNLFPVVLEGLARITHLMNIDMVEDLVVLLRHQVEGADNNVPDTVRLMCVHCALSTLSGPGQELNMDDEPFVVALRNLMTELPYEFDKWDKVLECVELCIIKHREARSILVVGMVRLLIAMSVHLSSPNAGVAALSLAHCILQRYPRARLSFEALQSTASRHVDDDVGDLAMAALKNSEAASGDLSLVSGGGDGSWMLPLLRLHVNRRYHGIVKIISSRAITPIPSRTADARPVSVVDYFNGIDKIFAQLPSRRGAGNSDDGKGLQKKQNSICTGSKKGPSRNHKTAKKHNRAQQKK